MTITLQLVSPWSWVFLAGVVCLLAALGLAVWERRP